MQLEVLEKVSERLQRIDDFLNLEERYYLKDLVMTNLYDDNLIQMADELTLQFEVNDEDRESAMNVVKEIYELIIENQ